MWRCGSQDSRLSSCYFRKNVANAPFGGRARGSAAGRLIGGEAGGSAAEASVGGEAGALRWSVLSGAKPAAQGAQGSPESLLLVSRSKAVQAGVKELGKGQSQGQEAEPQQDTLQDDEAEEQGKATGCHCDIDMDCESESDNASISGSVLLGEDL